MVADLAKIPILPLDEAFALTADFNADTNTKKVSLGAGVYRDENGKPWVLPSVKQAKEKLHHMKELNHEYLPIQGSERFLALARELILGDTLSSQANVVSIQTISGTGANHLGAQFLARHLKPKQVFMSDPTWNNHHLIWTIAAPDVAQRTYPYWDPIKKGLDFDGWVNTLETEASENDVVILHACAHNPTGLDPTRSQWNSLAKLFKRKGLFPFFDSAYQGFASGDLDDDAWAVRHFQEELMAFTETEGSNVDRKGSPGLCIAQSFAKSFGLYGERVGALHLSLPFSSPTSGAYSQMLQLVRAEISNPPLFGARIVETILSNPNLTATWKEDLQKISSRLIGVRQLLKVELEKSLKNGNWNHLVSQLGMFSYTGLTEAQVLRLRDVHHIYLMKSGRVSLSGVNNGNLKYIADAFNEVISHTSSLAE